MINDFLKYSEDNKLFKLQDNILLAVSGGIDSMVMADLFLKTMRSIAIAHCNFCLRGRDSDLDEDLVIKLSAASNIRIFTKRFNTLNYASQNHISVQMAARDLRYGWFEELRKEGGFDRIAVAHNLNDNIETLLINLTRGTGITGLAGMKPLSNNIIRPLLFATRDRIVDYANTFDVPFREDKSNTETKYIRNRIRHNILPLLKEINPSVESTLNDTALRMAGADEIVNLYTDRVRKKLIRKQKNYFSVKLSDLHHWLHNHTIIFELFRPYGITGPQVRDLINVIEGDTGTRIITDNFRIIRNREELIISGHAQKEILSFRVHEISDFQS
ncbi:MAG TPA: tRNA lysidine(34) synthetase TilS, partial [Bacteroidales bacterium]|nr:tRNA lysidine(34) synthetase TilS [Bacteroidales bacterium]